MAIDSWALQHVDRVSQAVWTRLSEGWNGQRREKSLGLVGALSIESADPVGDGSGFFGEGLQHLRVHFGQVEHVLDAVLAVVGVEGPCAEETDVSLGPHLVEPVLVLVDAMASLVLLQDLVQARSPHIAAQPHHVLALGQGVFVLLFLQCQPAVELELPDQGLTRGGVEDVDDAGLDHLVQAYRVVPAVVEYLEDLGVDHHVPKYLPSQPEGLEVPLLVHVPNIHQEGVFPVVELDHLHEPSLPQVALQVDPQDLTAHDVGGTGHQRLEAVDVVGLTLLQLLKVVHVEEQFFLLVGRLEGALAGLELELFKGLSVELRVEDELDSGKEQEQVALEDEVGLHLVEHLAIGSIEGLAQVEVEVGPVDHSSGQFLIQVAAGFLLNGIDGSLEDNFRSVFSQCLLDELSEVHFLILKNLVERRHVLRQPHREQVLLYQALLYLFIHSLHEVQELFEVRCSDLLFGGPSQDNVLLVLMGRGRLCCLEVLAAGGLADVGKDMVDIHGASQDLIEADAGELPQQEGLGEGDAGMLDFEELHELEVELLVQQVPDLGPDMLDFVEFSQGVDLFGLKLVQVFVDSGAFDGVHLGTVAGLVVVVGDVVALLAVVVVEVPDPVAEGTVGSVVDAEAAEVEAAEGLFGVRGVRGVQGVRGGRVGVRTGVLFHDIIIPIL